MTNWKQQGEDHRLTLGAFILTVWSRHSLWWMSLGNIIPRHHLTEAETLEQAKEMAISKALEMLEPGYKAAVEARHQIQVQKVIL